jgi:hypothetical protein
MSKRDSDAKRYRARAAELRAIAKDIKSQNERELLLKVASEYELMAQSAAISDPRNGNGPPS